MKFRKKPVVVEAFPVRELLYAAGHNWPTLPPWIRAAYQKGDVLFLKHTIEILTPEGRITALKSDWIIRGVQRELYPCKGKIFAATYEPVAYLEEARR